VFVGEYAAHLPPRAQGMRPSTLSAALAEAAFMTGLERNADVVGMSSYAPLFGHVDAWQWTPNLIWFDNLRSFGTPSYYVQQLFGQNRGGTILPVTINGSKANGQDGIYASASIDAQTREVVVKLVNPGGAPRAIQLALSGVTRPAGKSLAVLTGEADAENSLNEPTRIAPRAGQAVPDPAKPWTLPPFSVTVARIASE
jgi:alpha-L-arabinofuranosidase